MRRFFHLPPPSLRVAQLHVRQSGGQFEHDHLLFRDYLRTHPDERDACATLKRSAARKWRDDRIGYTYAKGGFILERQEKADARALENSWTLP